MERQPGIHRLTLGSLLGSSMTLGWATTVMACQCDSLSPEAAFEQADEVFESSVEQFEVTGEIPQAYIEHFQLSQADIERFHQQGDLARKATFRVKRVWKGSHESPRQIVTGVGHIDCGVPFFVGGVYLVYAKGGYTDSCMRTREYGDVSEDRAALGPGTPIVSDVPKATMVPSDADARVDAPTIPLLDLAEAEQASARGQGRTFYARYHGRPVIVEGVYESEFEHHSVRSFSAAARHNRAGTIWLEFSETLRANVPAWLKSGVRVRVAGVVECELHRQTGYGHLGVYDAQLAVDRIEQVEEERR